MTLLYVLCFHLLDSSNIEKCTVEGKEYKEGQKFYPANTCLDCVCQKGFKGKFEEPFCKRRRCGQQLRRDGRKIQTSCAPFYTKARSGEVLCCPEDWICSDDSEILKGDAKTQEICKFGQKDVKVGQYFEKANFKNFEKIKCECVVPPLLKCTDA
ncbi:hypothetical protein Zmor_013252 [Zophobas morio]|uniref:VWFC domain-containing protein n=1 Tax=Zophobas morio TaxID=2755281 RepID=A0AA38MF69_9CUCU|nr:hypothetical protein Zmor_013252 [Zophobas morio]